MIILLAKLFLAMYYSKKGQAISYPMSTIAKWVVILLTLLAIGIVITVTQTKTNDNINDLGSLFSN